MPPLLEPGSSTSGSIRSQLHLAGSATTPIAPAQASAPRKVMIQEVDTPRPASNGSTSKQSVSNLVHCLVLEVPVKVLLANDVLLYVNLVRERSPKRSLSEPPFGHWVTEPRVHVNQTGVGISEVLYMNVLAGADEWKPASDAQAAYEEYILTNAYAVFKAMNLGLVDIQSYRKLSFGQQGCLPTDDLWTSIGTLDQQIRASTGAANFGTQLSDLVRTKSPTNKPQAASEHPEQIQAGTHDTNSSKKKKKKKNKAKASAAFPQLPAGPATQLNQSATDDPPHESSQLDDDCGKKAASATPAQAATMPGKQQAQTVSNIVPWFVIKTSVINPQGVAYKFLINIVKERKPERSFGKQQWFTLPLVDEGNAASPVWYMDFLVDASIAATVASHSSDLHQLVFSNARYIVEQIGLGFLSKNQFSLPKMKHKGDLPSDNMWTTKESLGNGPAQSAMAKPKKPIQPTVTTAKKPTEAMIQDVTSADGISANVSLRQDAPPSGASSSLTASEVIPLFVIKVPLKKFDGTTSKLFINVVQELKPTRSRGQLPWYTLPRLDSDKSGNAAYYIDYLCTTSDLKDSPSSKNLHAMILAVAAVVLKNANVGLLNEAAYTLPKMKHKGSLPTEDMWTSENISKSWQPQASSDLIPWSVIQVPIERPDGSFSNFFINLVYKRHEMPDDLKLQYFTRPRVDRDKSGALFHYMHVLCRLPSGRDSSYETNMHNLALHFGMLTTKEANLGKLVQKEYTVSSLKHKGILPTDDLWTTQDMLSGLTAHKEPETTGGVEQPAVKNVMPAGSCSTRDTTTTEVSSPQPALTEIPSDQGTSELEPWFVVKVPVENRIGVISSLFINVVKEREPIRSKSNVPWFTLPRLDEDTSGPIAYYMHYLCTASTKADSVTQHNSEFIASILGQANTTVQKAGMGTVKSKQYTLPQMNHKGSMPANSMWISMDSISSASSISASSASSQKPTTHEASRAAPNSRYEPALIGARMPRATAATQKSQAASNLVHWFVIETHFVRPGGEVSKLFINILKERTPKRSLLGEDWEHWATLPRPDEEENDADTLCIDVLSKRKFHEDITLPIAGDPLAMLIGPVGCAFLAMRLGTVECTNVKMSRKKRKNRLPTDDMWRSIGDLYYRMQSTIPWFVIETRLVYSDGLKARFVLNVFKQDWPGCGRESTQKIYEPHIELDKTGTAVHVMNSVCRFTFATAPMEEYDQHALAKCLLELASNEMRRLGLGNLQQQNFKLPALKRKTCIETDDMYPTLDDIFGRWVGNRMGSLPVCAARQSTSPVGAPARPTEASEQTKAAKPTGAAKPANGTEPTDAVKPSKAKLAKDPKSSYKMAQKATDGVKQSEAGRPSEDMPQNDPTIDASNRNAAKGKIEAPRPVATTANLSQQASNFVPWFVIETPIVSPRHRYNKVFINIMREREPVHDLTRSENDHWVTEPRIGKDKAGREALCMDILAKYSVKENPPMGNGMYIRGLIMLAYSALHFYDLGIVAPDKYTLPKLDYMGHLPTDDMWMLSIDLTQFGSNKILNDVTGVCPAADESEQDGSIILEKPSELRSGIVPWFVIKAKYTSFDRKPADFFVNVIRESQLMHNADLRESVHLATRPKLYINQSGSRVYCMDVLSKYTTEEASLITGEYCKQLTAVANRILQPMGLGSLDLDGICLPKLKHRGVLPADDEWTTPARVAARLSNVSPWFVVETRIGTHEGSTHRFLISIFKENSHHSGTESRQEIYAPRLMLDRTGRGVLYMDMICTFHFPADKPLEDYDQEPFKLNIMKLASIASQQLRMGTVLKEHCQTLKLRHKDSIATEDLYASRADFDKKLPCETTTRELIQSSFVRRAALPIFKNFGVREDNATQCTATESQNLKAGRATKPSSSATGKSPIESIKQPTSNKEDAEADKDTKARPESTIDQTTVQGVKPAPDTVVVASVPPKHTFSALFPSVFAGPQPSHYTHMIAVPLPTVEDGVDAAGKAKTRRASWSVFVRSDVLAILIPPDEEAIQIPVASEDMRCVVRDDTLYVFCIPSPNQPAAQKETYSQPSA